MADQETACLRGRRLLVVEDEYMIAMYVVDALEDFGAEVLGPVATVSDALALLDTEQVDGASLDINLCGETVYPVAEVLHARGVPFIFVSGYDQKTIPTVYAHVPHCGKPVNSRMLANTLAAVYCAR